MKSGSRAAGQHHRKLACIAPRAGVALWKIEGASAATVVIADMTSTTFIDTSGVRALVLAHKAAAAKSAELRVAVSSPGVLRTLSLLRLDTYLSIYPTVAQAQAAGTVTGEPLPG